jgi:hypothetical protein
MRRLRSLFTIGIGLFLALSVSTWAQKRSLDETKIKECHSPVKKLSISPAEQTNLGKDICEVIHTSAPAWCIENWIEEGDSYASYQDPLTAGCIDPYPFQVAELYLLVCASMPVVTEFYVDVLEANLDDPSCPYPSEEVYTSDILTLEISEPGNYTVVVPVPLEERVCLDGPYFAGFNFPGPVAGLGPITDDTPDGCWDYIWFDTEPMDLVSEMGFPGNILLYSIGFTAAQNTCDEYPPPLPTIIQPRDTAWYDQTYFSDSVRITVDDRSDGSRIDHTTFDYMDPSGIWYPIGTDYDGTDVWFNTWDTAQVGGDGWSYVWVADGLPEDYYLIRATMTDSMGREASDTVTIYYDPDPPIPTIIQPESTGIYCGPIEVIFTLQADHIAEMEAVIYNFSEGWYTASKDSAADSTYNKGIPSMRQDTLYKWGKNIRGQKVNAGCAPTAAAACLTWWAGHGFPGITGGLSAKDLVDSLASRDYMKTSPSTGTKSSKFTSGLDKWLRTKLGICVFKYPLFENNPRKMTFDLYSREIKREDIIIGWGGKPWHATTGNSATAKSSTYDVMDPGTGQTTTYTWPRGPGNTRINQIWIISPKVQPQPPPATPGPPPIPDEEEEDHYRAVWTPNPAETPYNQWYSFEVTVTDSLGHVGRDMFHFELADYVCGDANGDGMVGAGDVVYNLSYLFREGPPPEPMESGDANCDGTVGAGDVVYLLSYLFRDGPLPGCF